MGGFARTLYDALCTLKLFCTTKSCGIWENTINSCKKCSFLNVRVKKYSHLQDSYVLQCIQLKTFMRLMFAALAIRELFLTVNFCRFTVG